MAPSMRRWTMEQGLWQLDRRQLWASNAEKTDVKGKQTRTETSDRKSEARMGRWDAETQSPPWSRAAELTHTLAQGPASLACDPARAEGGGWTAPGMRAVGSGCEALPAVLAPSTHPVLPSSRAAQLLAEMLEGNAILRWERAL